MYTLMLIFASSKLRIMDLSLTKNAITAQEYLSRDDTNLALHSVKFGKRTPAIPRQ